LPNLNLTFNPKWKRLAGIQHIQIHLVYEIYATAEYRQANLIVNVVESAVPAAFCPNIRKCWIFFSAGNIYSVVNNIVAGKKR
jgi:hypothetical protein